MEIGAQVAADRLRFREPPDTEVHFEGSPGHEAATVHGRTHLPSPVVPEEEYEDVRAAYRLENRLRGDPGSRPPR